MLRGRQRLICYRANLNSSYFSDRQDRYLHFSSQPHLAEYCLGFLQASSAFSYRLAPAPNAQEGYALHWEDDQTHPHHVEAKAGQTLSAYQESSRLGSISRLGQLNKFGGTGHDDVLVFPIIQAGQFGVREEERALAMLFSHLSQLPQSVSGIDSDYYNGPLMDLTSGYFGLYRDYRDLVLQADLRCRIIAAGPKVCPINLAIVNN